MAENNNATNSRVEMGQVEVVSQADEQCLVRVTLTLAGRSEQVEARGASKDDGALMLIGQSVRQGLKALLPRPLDFQIDYIKKVESKTSAPTSMVSLLRLREAGKEN